MNFKLFLREFLPPIAYKILRELTGSWRGNYPDWKTAQKKSIGYDSDIILHKVRDSLLKVKNGEAEYERDSVLFDRIEYSWPLLSVLLWSALQNKGVLDLVDFGGSLGSCYYQNKKFISNLKEVHWNIVEQDEFVKMGRRDFASKQLSFYNSIEECFSDYNPSLLLINSTLSYIEEPYSLLQRLLKQNFKHVFFDRTPFFNDSINKDRITIQKVPSSIYPASYPAWIFNKPNLVDFFNKSGYELVEDFYTNDMPGFGFCFQGLIFQKVD